MDRRTSHAVAFGLGFLTGALVLATLTGSRGDILAHLLVADLVALLLAAIMGVQVRAARARVEQCRAEADVERAARASAERALELAHSQAAEKKG
jgi:hypothetical protein